MISLKTWEETIALFWYYNIQYGEPIPEKYHELIPPRYVLKLNFHKLEDLVKLPGVKREIEKLCSENMPPEHVK